MKYSLLTVLMLLFIACNKNSDIKETSCDGSTPTFDNEISVIINTSCAISGCHPDADARHGDYSSYEAFEKHRNNGSFEKKVLTKQTMPKGFTLTQEELNLIQCWVDNGFPEN